MKVENFTFKIAGHLKQKKITLYPQNWSSSVHILGIMLTLILLFTTTPAFENSVDPGYTLFVIQFVNLN